MKPNRNLGRVGGVLLILSAITAGFYLTYLRSYVIVPNDAAATAANIKSAELWFRVAIVSNLFSEMCTFLFALLMFQIFKQADKWLATVFLVSVMMTVTLAVANMLHHFEALIFLSQPDYLRVFTAEQLNAMAMNSIRLANSPGQGLLEVFWTPYYLSFGLLVFKYRFIPKILGVFLMMMGVGFAINILDKFLVPQFHPVAFTRFAMMLGALGGLPTMFWLLIKGVNEPRLDQ